MGTLFLAFICILIGLCTFLGSVMGSSSSIIGILCAVAFIGLGIFFFNKKRKYFDLASSSINGDRKIRLILYSHIPQFTFRGGVEILQNDSLKQIEISNPMSNSAVPVTLKYSQICSFDIVPEYNVPLENYDGSADAVAGALMFGVVGAVIGGAIGSNIKTYPVKNCLLINFHPKNNSEEIRTLFFGINSSSFNKNGFLDDLREKTDAEYLDNSL